MHRMKKCCRYGKVIRFQGSITQIFTFTVYTRFFYDRWNFRHSRVSFVVSNGSYFFSVKIQKLDEFWERVHKSSLSWNPFIGKIFIVRGFYNILYTFESYLSDSLWNLTILRTRNRQLHFHWFGCAIFYPDNRNSNFHLTSETQEVVYSNSLFEM